MFLHGGEGPWGCQGMDLTLLGAPFGGGSALEGRLEPLTEAYSTPTLLCSLLGP